MVLHRIPEKVWRISSNCEFWIADTVALNARIVSGRSQLLLAKAIIRVTVRRLKPVFPLATK